MHRRPSRDSGGELKTVAEKRGSSADFALRIGANLPRSVVA
ncbi:hypothetical protein APY04_0911 [Hyphomicrobium sulfonivorans]|uniref:Uncharacterized protein n=1 Tax=Hyphomicrobium sulfonivorans TaxID=121290 RepID=A0A109BKS1_HYPSL|nr:hypothetical protein APY04_0911 [Hyphomicrobium sulfonivorans]